MIYGNSMKYLLLLALLLPNYLNAQALEILGKKPAEYEIKPLAEELGISNISTVTTWTNGEIVEYQGVSLYDLILSQKLDSPTILVTAEDGYSSKISLDLIKTYRPIIAFSADGQALTFENRGPLSLIWPRSEYPSDLDETSDGMWVWYVKKISPID